MAQGPARGILTPILLPHMARIRGAVPGGLGMHQSTVTLKSWLWTSDDGAHVVNTGVATPYPDLVIGHYSTTTGLIEPPHVSTDQGGSEVTVDYITPPFYNASNVQIGGFRVDQLVPPDAPGFEYVYVVGLPQGPRNYIVGPRGLITGKPLHYTLHLVSSDLNVPF